MPVATVSLICSNLDNSIVVAHPGAGVGVIGARLQYQIRRTTKTMPISVPLSRGDLGALPNLVAAGAAGRVRAPRRSGRRSASRPSLPLRWCIWAADRLAAPLQDHKVDSVH